MRTAILSWTFILFTLLGVISNVYILCGYVLRNRKKPTLKVGCSSNLFFCAKTCVCPKVLSFQVKRDIFVLCIHLGQTVRFECEKTFRPLGREDAYDKEASGELKNNALLCNTSCQFFLHSNAQAASVGSVNFLHISFAGNMEHSYRKRLYLLPLLLDECDASAHRGHRSRLRVQQSCLWAVHVSVELSGHMVGLDKIWLQHQKKLFDREFAVRSKCGSRNKRRIKCFVRIIIVSYPDSHSELCLQVHFVRQFLLRAPVHRPTATARGSVRVSKQQRLPANTGWNSSPLCFSLVHIVDFSDSGEHLQFASESSLQCIQSQKAATVVMSVSAACVSTDGQSEQTKLTGHSHCRTSSPRVTVWTTRRPSAQPKTRSSSWSSEPSSRSRSSSQISRGSWHQTRIHDSGM